MGFGCCFGGSMANFQRLIFSVFSLFFVVSSNATIAPLPPGAAEYCDMTGHGPVCQSYVAANLYGPGGVCQLRHVSSNNTCMLDLQTSTQLVKGTEGWSGRSTPLTKCPSGSAVSGASCVCVLPSVDVGGVCVVPPDACAEHKSGEDWVTVSGMVTAVKTSCISDVGGASGPSCSGTFSPGVIVKDKVTGAVTTQGSVTYSGGGCTPTVPAGDAAPEPCKGQAGSVNGVSVCLPYPADATKVENSTKTSTPSTGGTAGTDTAGTVKSESKNTQCTGNTCTTTTTTTTTAPGQPPVTTSEKKEQDKDSFCVENPTVQICKTSSLGSGNCSAPDTCDGDAIQCAIAARSLKIQCALNPDPDGSDADYIAAKGLTGKQTGNLPGNETVNVGAGNFDTSDALGGGSCIANRTVVIAGSSITIPFSDVCTHLAMLGNLLLTVSFLLAGRIVVRG